MKNVCNIISRNVATWSPLASTFNSKPLPRVEFSFRKSKQGLFLNPLLKTADGFYLAKQNAIEKSNKLVQEAISPHRSRKMVEVFDELSNSLCQVADLAEFIRLAHPDKQFVVAAEDASVTISGLVEKLNTHRDLYDALKRVQVKDDVLPTTPMDRHVGELFQFDFEQSGIHLDKDKRSEVVKLLETIIYLSQVFSEGIVQPREVHKSALLPSVKNFFNISGDTVTVNGLYSEHNNELAREAAYRIYLHPDSQQEHVLKELLTSRHQLAQLCGFPTYGHRAIKGSLADTPEFVSNFLDLLKDAIQPTVDMEMEVMKQMKKKLQGSQNLMVWDPPYLSAVGKNRHLSVDEVAPYFSIGVCMDGLAALVESLYGIRLEVEPTEIGEVWNPLVYKLAVRDEQGELLGYIYCDFFDRRGKHHQDCHFTIQGSKLLPDNSYQIPIVVLNLSLQPPSMSWPSLLTPPLLDNLFHEMGHALHSIMGRTKYQHVAGTRCPIDMSEVPSTLMEYFVRDVRVLRSFARHYKTGQVIPEELAHRMSTSRQFFPAMEMQQQVFYSALDHILHQGPLQHQTTTDVLRHAHEKYYSLPYVENTAWQLRFGHLVGYGAKYYSYLMARAVSSWIWQELFQNNPMNREMGERFRVEVLAHGGEKPPRDMIFGILKRKVTPEALVSALQEEIGSIQKLNTNFL